MTVGMFFAALAFVAAALVQINIDVRNSLGQLMNILNKTSFAHFNLASME